MFILVRNWTSVFSEEEWTWEDIAHAVKFSDKAIAHSLLKDLGSDEDKHAVETFHGTSTQEPEQPDITFSPFPAIMKFMGDEPLKKSESMTDVVFKVLIICHRHPTLIDEVYCQLVKQTSANNSVK